MILDKEIEIKVSSSNFNYYKNLDYNVKVGEYIIVKVSDLSKGSNVYISTKCYYCGEIKKSTYKNYITQTKVINKYSCNKCGYLKKIETVRLKYGVDYTIQLDEIKNRRNETNINKYGGKSPFSSKNIREKSKLTLLKNYSVENPFKSSIIIDKIKKTNIENGKWSIDDNYNSYRRGVISLTNKVKMNLFEEWNGFDYYDHEYIKDNLNLSKNSKFYPTIDHKISVLYGYINGISIEEISDISNLCITKKYINSKKSSLTEDEFKTA
jgi:hypothetical protein